MDNWTTALVGVPSFVALTTFAWVFVRMALGDFREPQSLRAGGRDRRGTGTVN